MSNKPQFVGEKVRLGELITKAPVERCGDRDFPVYSMTMHDGIVEQAGRFKKAIASKDTSSYKVVRKNQLVVGFPIDEGVIYVQNHETPGIMSPAYNVWNFDLSQVNPAYLELALHSPQSMAYYADKMRGTTARRRSLTADGLRALEIPLPPIDAQLKVVKMLNGVKSQINAANHQIAELDSLVKSRFIEMFGETPNASKYEIRQVGSIADVFVGVVVKPKQYYSDDPENAVKAFRSLNVGEMTVRDDDWVYFTHEGNRKASKSVLKGGDVLVVRSGYPGTSCVVPAEYEGSNAIDLIIARVVSQKIRPEFLAAFNNSDYVKNLIASTSVGSAQKHFNVGFYKRVELSLPPIETQDEFIVFQRQVDKSRFVAQQQIEKLQTLHDSLAQDYFG